MEFRADKLSINGPRVDGSFKVSFDVGEYEQSRIAELLLIPPQTILKITVEKDNG